MRNNRQDLEKEKRANGMQPLSRPGMGPEAGAVGPGQAQQGTMGTCASRATGRTQRELAVKGVLTAGFHHPENGKLAI